MSIVLPSWLSCTPTLPVPTLPVLTSPGLTSLMPGAPAPTSMPGAPVLTSPAPASLTAATPPAEGDSVGALGAWLTEVLAGFVIPTLGALAGIALAFVLSLFMRIVASKSRLLRALLKRVTLPFMAMLGAWGAWVSLIVQDLWARMVNTDVDIIDQAAAEAQAMTAYQHVFLIVAIGATTWFVYSWLWILEDAARLRAEADAERASRFATQAQVLRRLGQVIIVVVGVAFMVFTFPSARQFMGGLLASAGLVSVIAGLAAQSTLSNVFAGLQLAFTDAIRVGDTVVAGPKDQSGVIEEITLAYVVIRIWDERRIVIPSNSFTTSPFENWSRRETQQQGTVELRLDWGAPMAQIRQKVASLLASSDLWDGRNWAVHVTDADKDTILVRIVVSARNPSELFELRAMIRERLIDWVMTEEPWVRPAFLVRQQDVEHVERDMSGEQLARLAAELSGIAADGTAPGVAATVLRPAGDEAARPRLSASGDGVGAASTRPGTPADRPRPTADSAGGPADKPAGSPAGSVGVAGGRRAVGAGGPEGSGRWSHGDNERKSGVPRDAMTDTHDHAHAARLKAARQKAKKARRRAMAERQRELAEGRKIAGEAEGNPNDLATQVMTTISSTPQTSRTARGARQEGSSSD